MPEFLNLFENIKKNRASGSNSTCRFDKQGRAHVTLYTHFFVNLPGNFLCTNRMYREFRDEVAGSVDLVNTDTQVVLEIYEPAESDEFNRQAAIAGFRRFIETQAEVEYKRFKSRMVVFIALLLVGIALEFVLHGMSLTLLPAWGDNCVDIMATVFVWQFIGFMAYEYQTEKIHFRRLKQMVKTEYVFQKWE